MESQSVCDISERPRYNIKKHPFVYFIDDPLGKVSQILPNLLHIGDVRSYIHSKFKSVGDDNIHKDLGVMCNGYLSLKYKYAYMNELNLNKYMFYMEFDNHEWTRIILSQFIEEFFWVGDVPIVIINESIHKVIGLRNEGCDTVNDGNVRKTVETNLQTKFDGRNMKVDMIQDKGVKVLRKIMGYKLNHSSRVNSMPIGFMHATYIMAVEKKKVNMCETIRVQLLDNIVTLEKSKSAVFRLKYLLTHLFFYATKLFPGMKNWDSNGCSIKMAIQCNRDRLENVRDNDIDRMMKSFQSEMKLRYRIPPSTVVKYKDEICFMVEINTTCMEEVEPRVNFIETMDMK